MREVFKVTLRLFVITAIAGLALGITNALTKDPIARQAELQAVQARQTVLPEADEFKEVTESREGIDSAFLGVENGETVGCAATVTVKGYGGDIEVTVGMDTDGCITGVTVGGSSFSESPGFGARAKEPDFVDQFLGLESGIDLGTDIDAITGATITSQAVTDGVNQASEYIMSLLSGGDE